MLVDEPAPHRTGRPCSWTEGETSMPSVLVPGRPVAACPPFAPEARRGSVRRVTEAGEEVLRKPCRDVTGFGPDLAALIDGMVRTMYVTEGAGPAAHQVGVGPRLFVMTARTTRESDMSGISSIRCWSRSVRVSGGCRRTARDAWRCRVP
jgi:hypothetical protein